MATVEIPLTQGKVALIEEEDLPLVSGYKWYAARSHSGTYYATHRGWERVGRRSVLLMHRVILGNPEGWSVDHKNRDGLDNRRGNLRLATQQQQAGNVGLTAKNTSGYRGVIWYKSCGKWAARVGRNPCKFLGFFPTKEEAALAYDREAIKRWGGFAYLNFPDGVVA